MYYNGEGKVINASDTRPEREVTLTIPGIYYYGNGDEQGTVKYAEREFADVTLYNAITDTVNDKNATSDRFKSIAGYTVYRVETNDKTSFVLLAAGAKNTVASLPAQASSSLSTIAKSDDGIYYLTGVTSFKGIQYLTGTKAFYFKGATLGEGETLQPFYLFTKQNNSLQKLALIDCGLNDDKVWGGESDSRYSYLSNLNRLIYADLSNSGKVTDGIQSISKDSSPIVYRTVQTLKLKYQSLRDIQGVSELTALQTLDISCNSISSFTYLKNCSALTSVYLYGNSGYWSYDNDNNGGEYYGSAGLVNVPVYVALNDNGVTVYNDYSDNQPVAFTADATTVEIARALNAVAYGGTQTGSINFAAEISGGNDYSYKVVPVIVLQWSENMMSDDNSQASGVGVVTAYAVSGSNGEIEFEKDKPSGEIYLVVMVTSSDEPISVYCQYKMDYAANGGA
jgi:hypothetical protein